MEKIATKTAPKQECYNCAAPVDIILRCGGCLIPIYCNEQCQKHHWKEGHKIFCRKNKKPTECLHQGYTEISCLICKNICCDNCHHTHNKKFHPPESGEICVICMSTMEKSDFTTLNCYHRFHNDCILELQKTTNRCPSCRLYMDEDPLKIMSDLLKLPDSDDIEKNKIILSKSIRSLNDLADRNNADAQFILGMLFKDGLGLDENGIIIDENSIHLDRDHTKAFELIFKASEQDNVRAINEVGICFEYGYGVEKNPTKAFEYYEKAAKRKNKDGQYNLGMSYANGHGVNKDIKKALYYLSLARDQLHPKTSYEIANIYFKSKNIKMAIKYFKYAAEEENCIESQVTLGLIFYERKSYIEAFKYFKYAADQDNPFAQFMIGILYKNGMGIKKDFKKAFEYIIKSYEQKQVEAITELGCLYYYGIEVEQNYARAFECLSESANMDDPRSQYNLAIMYENGHGIIQNYDMALKLYIRAAEKNFEKSHKKVIELTELIQQRLS
jgi:TPR repeat protein